MIVYIAIYLRKIKNEPHILYKPLPPTYIPLQPPPYYFSASHAPLRFTPLYARATLTHLYYHQFRIFLRRLKFIDIDDMFLIV